MSGTTGPLQESCTPLLASSSCPLLLYPNPCLIPAGPSARTMCIPSVADHCKLSRQVIRVAVSHCLDKRGKATASGCIAAKASRLLHVNSHLGRQVQNAMADRFTGWTGI